MENEKLGNNGYDSCESQKEYISIREQVDKKAEKYVKVSLIFFGVSFVCQILYEILGLFWINFPNAYNEETQEIITNIYTVLSGSARIVSLIYSILGYRLKKTNLAQGLLIVNLLLSIGGIIMAVELLGGLYLFLNALL